jgi:acyl-coenzyme A synthetase/AMP-(fatty) acid ligase
VAAAHAQTICFDDAFVAARLAGAGTVRARDVPQIEAQSAVAIGFTSGSTGRPQPHLKRWSSFGAVSALNAGLVRERLVARGCTGAASLVATVPPQHMYGMETSVLLPLLGGMAVHAGRPLFPGDVAAALAEVPAPRVLITTPVHLRALLDSGLRFPPVALVLSATAPLDPTLAVGIECLLDTELRELFGSTETCVIAHRRTACEDAWTAYPGVTLAAGSDCTTVSMPWFAEPTALQDVVEVQADGRFVLRGRNADLIEIAGKRASLAELTRRVLALPGVRDAVVFQPDGEGAVRRVAALVVAPGCTAEELAAQLRGMIDSAFMPRPLLCVAELPRNEVGKLARAKLLAALQTATAPG